MIGRNISAYPHLSNRRLITVKYGATAFIVLFLAGIEILNFTGFCYPRVRYCSDRELIDIAVNRALDWRQRFMTAPSQVIYTSIDDFYSKNANCCRLTRWNKQTDSVWARAFGFYVATAEIWYRESDTGNEPYYDSEISLTACGKILHTRGISMPFVRPN